MTDKASKLAWRVLRVDLGSGAITVEEQGEKFIRRHLGGQGVAAWYLNREVPPGVEPFDPGNRLIFTGGLLTGLKFPGAGRGSVAARSPLTGGFGCAEFGGYFSAELRHAGWDTLIVQGRAPEPVYLHIVDDQVEIRPAAALWGLETGPAQAAILAEVGDPKTRVACIGPAGENRVRYAAVIADLRHAAGRTGLGAVMGGKNLKAVAVRGHGEVGARDPERVERVRRALTDELATSVYGKFFGANGTAGGLSVQNAMSVLPTQNFRAGSFAEARAISGEELNAKYLASTWGDAAGALALLEDIAHRRGASAGLDPALDHPRLGDLLAEGVKRAAAEIGRGSEEWAMQVHGQELPMHEPKGKWGVGLGYVASVTGADHNTAAQDTLFAGKGRPVDLITTVGVDEPVPPLDLGPRKVRAYAQLANFSALVNCLVLCNFVTAPTTGLNLTALREVVAGVTGWDVSDWELLAAGERATVLARCFNVRHGAFGDDRLPARLHVPFEAGMLRGKTVTPEEFARAVALYYEMMGYDERGVPRPGRLVQLQLDWLAGEIGHHSLRG